MSYRSRFRDLGWQVRLRRVSETQIEIIEVYFKYLRVLD